MKKKLFISTSLSVMTLFTCLSFVPTSTVKADTINSKTTLSTQSRISRAYTCPGYIDGYYVNIRKGAGTNTESLGQLNTGDVVTVTNWNYSSNWVQIKNPFGSGYAYVYYKYVSSGSID